MDIRNPETDLPGDMLDYYRHFQSALYARWEDCLDHGTSPLGNNKFERRSLYNLTGSLPALPHEVPRQMVESATMNELEMPDDQSILSSFSGLAISKGLLPYDWNSSANIISESQLYRGHGEGIRPQIGNVDSCQLQNGFLSNTDEYLLNSGFLEDFYALKFDLLSDQRQKIGICETHGGYTMPNQVPKHPDVAAGFGLIPNDEQPYFFVDEEPLSPWRTLRHASENLIPLRNPEKHNSHVNYLYNDVRKAYKTQQVPSTMSLLDEQKQRLLSHINELPYPDGLYSWRGSRFHPVPWNNAPETSIPSLHIDKSNSVLNSPDLMEHFSDLNNAEKSAYFLAKDQEGCRYLQWKISEGRNKDIEMILLEVTDHLVELSMDPFGNYLVQKLFDACNEDQRTRMLRSITMRHGDLLRISSDIHGTRVVQKIVETLKDPEHLSILVSSLKHNILTLMKNTNGTHVSQHCLRFLPQKYMEILFENVATNCIELATDRHGCCVLQKCIAHSSREQRFRLTRAVALNSRILSQDEFGNYAVQFILDKKEARATEDVIGQLEGHFVNLSKQKYSSNVVESCLKLADEEHRTSIIQELIESPQLDQILQDPYGNYVIQSAVMTSKGALRAAIVKAVKPYVPALLANPYGKKVLSNKYLKNIKWHLV